MPASATAARPGADEYAAYYEKYVSMIEGDVLETLARQGAETASLLGRIQEDAAGSRYEPGKWSVKELVGHIIDTERIFAYRALRFARGDRTPLEGFDQDPYVAAGNFDARTLASLAEEFAHVRASTLALLRSLDPEAWARRGAANDNEVTVRALAYITAGHEAHHVNILRERYLK
ncbi:MAG: DinB family protein [Acidobacteria bacterium]|nr:DinB family protein [Acidobacteriota bacterium]